MQVEKTSGGMADGAIALREMSGRFATGVTVISAGDGHDVHGMKANVFMSILLNPELVLVSLKNDSRMRQMIEAHGLFGISILRSDQTPASEHFAGRTDDAPSARFSWRQAAPILDGALAWITCSAEQQHLAGDHTLFIGRV